MKLGSGAGSIVVADDDREGCMLMETAFARAGLRPGLVFVNDGASLLDYLGRQGRFAAAGVARPDLILLDLVMPRMSGFDVLDRIKRHAEWRSIPVVVLSGSDSHEDVRKSYDLGANSCILKPVSFEALLQLARDVTRYWCDTVELPIRTS